MAYLPYDALRWACQNGTFGNDRLATFFAGNGATPLDTDPEAIDTGMMSLTGATDFYFFTQPGDTTQQVEFYDWAGSAAANGHTPLAVRYLPVGAITWQNLPAFTGEQFGAWVPLNPSEPVACLHIRLTGRKGTFPKRIRFSGTVGYTKKVRKASQARLANKSKVNTYWYNYHDPANVHGPAPAANLAQLGFYDGGRYYVPAQNILSATGIRISPAMSGGAHYDDIFGWWIGQQKDFLLCLMGNSPENIQSFVDNGNDPAFIDDGGNKRDPYDIGSNAMWKWGANLLDPETYRWLGVLLWQLVARYGNVVWADNLLTAATTPYTQYDPTHQKKSGLGLLGPGKGKIQIGNELAKVWKLLLAYLPPEAAAVLYAVALDGYNGTMGPYVGVKNADATVDLLLGILYSADAGYVLAFGEALRGIYGSNPDGTVKNFPTQNDVHEYARARNGSGVPFSQSVLPARFDALADVLQRLGGENCHLVLSEYGYARTNAAAGYDDDSNYRSTGYSFLQPTAELPDPAIRRAACTVDMAVELGEYGVEEAWLYDDEHSNSTATQDAPWDTVCDTNDTPTQAWMKRLSTVSAGYARTSSIRQNGGLIARFAKAGAGELVAMTAGATSLVLASAASVQVYDLATGTLGAAQGLAAGATYARTASEVPTLLLLSTSSATTPGTGSGGTGSGSGTPPPANSTMILQSREPEGGADPNAVSKTATANQTMAGQLTLPDATFSSAPAAYQSYVALATYVASLVLGSAPWAAGKQTTGALVYSDSAVWRVKVDIANSQTAPTQAAGSTQYYEFVGGPAVLTALAQVAANSAAIGTTTALTTTAKVLVPAINEVRALITALVAYNSLTPANAAKTDGYITPVGLLNTTGFVAAVFTATGAVTRYASHQLAVAAMNPNGTDCAVLAGTNALVSLSSPGTYFCAGLLTRVVYVGSQTSAAGFRATVYGVGVTKQLQFRDGLGRSDLRVVGAKFGSQASVGVLATNNRAASSASDAPSFVLEDPSLLSTEAYAPYAGQTAGQIDSMGSGLVRVLTAAPDANTPAPGTYGYSFQLTIVNGSPLVNQFGPLATGRMHPLSRIHLQGTKPVSYGTAAIAEFADWQTDKPLSAADAAALVLDERSQGGGSYTLPQATATQLGGLKLGQGLSYNSQTGQVDATGNGGTPAPSSIDYANPVLHSAGVTLAAADCGKHHVFQGTGQALWTVALPDPATCKYQVLSVQIGNSASGMWALQGTDIDGEGERRMWTRETALLWSTGTGWRKLAGRTIPLRAHLTGDGSGAISVGTQQLYNPPLATVVSTSLPALAAPAGLLTCLRANSYTVLASDASVLTQPCSEIDLFVAVNGAYNNAKSKVDTLSSPGFPGSGSYVLRAKIAETIDLALGDTVQLTKYAEAAYQLANASANPAYIFSLEIIETPSW